MKNRLYLGTRQADNNMTVLFLTAPTWAEALGLATKDAEGREEYRNAKVRSVRVIDQPLNEEQIKKDMGWIDAPTQETA